MDELKIELKDLYERLRLINKHLPYPYDETNDDEKLSVSFEFETKNGEVIPFHEDSHYGTMILTDGESEYWVKKLMKMGYIESTDCGMIELFEDNIVVEKTEKVGVFNFGEDGSITKV